MRTGPIRLLAAALLAATLPLAAQTLRWSSQGDLQTLDPHSQNESLTNALNGQVYESLVNRGKQLEIVPVLATEWQQTAPTVWRLKLRPNVKFHDGTPFSADDVVFSVQRAAAGTSDIKVYASALGEPRKLDALTVEFRLAQVNPIFLQHLTTIPIMSKAWSEKHSVTRPLDFKAKEESHASLNANGTGPFMLATRQPDVKTVYKRNPAWWGKFEGNLQEVVFSPIKSDATRVAALISGEIDLVLDPAPQDVPRLRNTSGLKVVDGPENRVVFIGMDQSRDKLLYGRVDGKNPFKDLRVRRALYQAIDVETIRTKLMRGQSLPTGGLTPSPLGAFNDPELEQRLPLRRGGSEEADAGGRFRQRLRGHARLPEQPLHQRRGDLPRAGGDVGPAGRKTQGQRDAAQHLLPEGAEVRHLALPARLGRFDHRRRDRDDSGLSQPRRGRCRLLELRWRQQCEVRRTGRSLEPRARPEEARGADQGRARRVSAAGPCDPVAPPGDPLGHARQRQRGPPGRQLARVAVDQRQVTTPKRPAAACRSQSSRRSARPSLRRQAWSRGPCPASRGAASGPAKPVPPRLLACFGGA